MSTVKVVPNKKTGKLYQPTSNGKFHRVQVACTGSIERDGFFFKQNQIGFAYFQDEAQCIALIEMAKANGMQIPGKIVYLDQLVPITEEAKEYGKQYPYVFRHNGMDLDPVQREAIQRACIENRLALRQSGQAIYRKKIYTTDLTRQSVILSPDNMDQVNAFISTVLKSSVDPKAARLAELKGTDTSKLTPAEKKAIKLEIAELED